MMKKLSEEDCLKALEAGDFDSALVAGTAAIILTQSWCPQWVALKKNLSSIEDDLKDINIFYVEYDIEEWEKLDKNVFMDFKENTFKNREIPYIRYYIDGKFSRDSNYISADGFKSRLGLA